MRAAPKFFGLVCPRCPYTAVTRTPALARPTLHCPDCAMEGRGEVPLQEAAPSAPPAAPGALVCATCGTEKTAKHGGAHYRDKTDASGRLVSSNKCGDWKVAVLLLVALALSACASMHADWKPPTRVETAIAGAAVAAAAVDVATTCAILNDPMHWELNPLLGEHPSCAKVAGVTAGTLAALGVAWWLLPTPWRDAVSGATLFVEVGADLHNGVFLLTGWSFP